MTNLPQKVSNANSNLFLFKFNNYTVSWRPDFYKYSNKDWRFHFNKLKQTLIKQFGFNKKPSKVKFSELSLICDEKIAIGAPNNALTPQTIGSFWKALEASKTLNALNFAIIRVKTVTIWSPQLQNSSNFTAILPLTSTKESMGDWEVPCGKLVTYLNEMTQSPDISIEDAANIDYDSLKYQMFKIERDSLKELKNESKTSGLSVWQVSKLRQKYDCDIEITAHDDFGECYDSEDSTNGQECAIFVENKHYFVISMGNNNINEYEWHPSFWNNSGQIDWQNEYSALKVFVATSFGLKNNNNLSIWCGNWKEKDIIIEDDSDMDGIWQDMERSDTKITQLFVNGESSQNVCIVSSVYFFFLQAKKMYCARSFEFSAVFCAVCIVFDWLSA